MADLSRELVWTFLTSYPLVQSKKQWNKRQNHYDSLVALWHRLFVEGHDLVFFRLCERRYEAALLHSDKIDQDAILDFTSRQELKSEIFKFDPLKRTSDLCDGEIINYAYLGSMVGTTRNCVVGITMDKPAKIQQRMGIFERVLTDLKRDVDDWNVEMCLGKIISLDLSNNCIVLNPNQDSSENS